MKGIAVECADHRPEKLGECLSGLPLERYEDEPRPDLAAHRHEPVVGFVEIEELALLLDVGAFSVESVCPPVVFADELATIPLRLGAGIIGPDEFVPAVAADVVERADDAINTPDDDHRRARDGELLGEIAAVARELLDSPNVEPHALEDRLALELVELRGDRILVGHRTGSKLGVVRRPAARR